MSIVSEFNKVRDIPYVIPLSLAEEDCCCSGKAKLLKGILENQGYSKVCYRVCSFSWSGFDLPAELAALPHEDMSTHVYLEIEIDGKQINIDPTWDRFLVQKFEISERDGISSTSIAVKPIELFSYEESARIMESTSDQEVLDDLLINGIFYKAFNERLETIRKSNI